MGTPKNTISSSKRRKGADSGQRRFSTRSKKKNGDGGLPAPAGMGKARPRGFPVRMALILAFLLAVAAVVALWRRRSRRRQALIEGLDSDHVLGKSADTAKILDGLKRRHSEEEDDNRNGSRADGGSDKPPFEGEDGAAQNGGGGGGTEAESAGHAAAAAAAARDVPTTPHVRTEADEEAAIKDFPSTIEWYERDDMKGGRRPLCRVAKPCLLSNGMLALPSWMQKSETLLHKCGLGAHIFYESLTDLPGVSNVQKLGVDFALTIHPERFQEPTHALSVFLNEHLLKSSFLFDTFAGNAHVGQDVRVSHCVTSSSGANECTTPLAPPPGFHAALFVPRRMKISAKSRQHAYALGLIDMFGRAHAVDGHVVHLNLSTMLVKSHREMSDGLSATCFRSVLSADAMFRHLPPRSLSRSSLLSSKNSIERQPRARKSGACALTVGIFDLAEGPRGIVDIPALKNAISQISRLALPSATVTVDTIRADPDMALTDLIRSIQGFDVLIAGSGEELSGLSFLRENSLVFEILQFGMVPDTYRSLANILGVGYYSLQSRPASDTFKNCLETQILNLRKKGVLGGGEYPAWWGALMSAWDSAAADFTLSGKTDFDILSNHTAIANFDSRHCAKMQNLEFNHEEAARSIVLQAKSLCETE